MLHAVLRSPASAPWPFDPRYARPSTPSQSVPVRVEAGRKGKPGNRAGRVAVHDDERARRHEKRRAAPRLAAHSTVRRPPSTVCLVLLRDDVSSRLESFSPSLRPAFRPLPAAR